MAFFRSLAACLFFSSCVTSAVGASIFEYEYSDEDLKPVCDDTVCTLPNCSCFGALPKVPLAERPQLVMLTFDDAITVANIDTYRKLAKKDRFKKDVKMTFYVCHEYNDYTLTQSLYNDGHEIAVHSISHESNTDLWRHASEEKWKQEMFGMRTMLTTFGKIPEKEMVGHRTPFLQTAGDNTFSVIKREGFLYDSSMPTRNFMDPPIWPYTLDLGYSQDCQIEPCPSGIYKGLWEVPMIQYHRSSREGDFYCSMLDACTPQPVTASDTKNFLMNNFNRHYKSNKAPFPMFLHEAWLRDKGRMDGFMLFLDEILKNQDVFAVTTRDVVEYIRNPVSYTNFSPRSHQAAPPCTKTETCTYKEPPRIMKSCTPCPNYYPWVGSPLGGRKPKNFPNWNAIQRE